MSQRLQKSSARDKRLDNSESRPRRRLVSPVPAAGSTKTAKRTMAAKQPQSLAEQAYLQIKDLVIRCVLRPGEYINESQLCERLKISRTPVHYAIAQLQQERFVDVMPRKGIIVRPISMDEYFALDETRLILECGAVRLAAKRITSGQLQELDALVARANEARRNRDIQMVLLSDRDFHFFLAKATHNAVLAAMLKAAYERSMRVWFLSSSVMTIDEGKGDHEQIARMLRERDADKASELMREHILASRPYVEK